MTTPIYKDSAAPIASRINDLIPRMTLGFKELCLLNRDYEWVVEPGLFKSWLAPAPMICVCLGSLEWFR